MCGIIGYVGDKQASDVIIEGLKYLEYRGYDSSGIAVVSDGIKVAKKQGRIANLEQHLTEHPLAGHLAIGHTRWATHGQPNDKNAHPFLSYRGKYAVVHNGIIENYLELKELLSAEGVTFLSQTDSEAVAHLLDYLDDGDPEETIRRCVERLKGAFSLGIVCGYTPDVLYAAKKDSPLIVGSNGGESFICSDINSLQNFLDEVTVLNNGHMAVLDRSGVRIYDFFGNPVDGQSIKLNKEENGGLAHYECYMDKEIQEIPVALRRSIAGYRKGAFDKIDKEYLKSIRRINIVACGTALHAGMYGERLIRRFLPDVDVYSEMASEFRYGDVKVDDYTLTITISQSGETADTLTCQKMVTERGGRTLTICNVATSGMVHYADYALLTNAGPEVAVASTKAYNCQNLVFAMFVFDLAYLRGNIDEATYDRLQMEIDTLPDKADDTMALRPYIEKFGNENFTRKSVFFLGRGMDYCVAMEGSMKLKGISYIHCEAYAAGELKHGTLALIEEDVLVVAMVTQRSLLEKMYNSLVEVKTRGAKIMVVTPFSDDKALSEVADYTVAIPSSDDMLYPIFSIIPAQLLSYYVARAKGCDVDKPRNLAKSVTVE